MDFGELIRGLFKIFQTVVHLSNNENSKQKLSQISQMGQAYDSMFGNDSGSYFDSALSSVGSFFGGEQK